jgi:hypothetical protein
MFDQILDMYELNRQQGACKIIKKHIQKIMDDDSFFVAPLIEDEIKQIMDSQVVEGDLYELFDYLLDFRSKCRRFLYQIEKIAGDNIDQLFEDFLKDSKMHEIDDKAKDELKDLAKSIKKSKQARKAKEENS